MGDFTGLYKYVVGEPREDGAKLQMELYGDRTKGNELAYDPEKFQ